MLNYKTVKIQELGANIIDNAKRELAPILGKTEVDEVVAGAISSISEIMDRMFVVGHITDPHLVFERGSRFFEPNGKPKPLGEEIFDKLAPEKLSPEIIAKVACYVKSKIMELFYADFLKHLQSSLKTLSHKKEPIHQWNEKNLMISKRQNLHDFLRTTVAGNPAEYFKKHFMHGLSEEWMKTYDPKSDIKNKKTMVLHKPEERRRSQDPITAHIKEAGRHEIVRSLLDQTRIKERTESGDEVESDWARKDMLAANGRMVIAQAKKHMSGVVINSAAIDMDDLIGQGNVGLHKGFEKYDPGRGFKFATYGTWWVKQSVTRHIQERAHTVRTPIYRLEDFRKANATRIILANALGREPSNEEIAAKMEISVAKLEKILDSLKSTSSLNASIDGLDEDDEQINSLTYKNGEMMTDDGEKADMALKMAELINFVLTPKEAAVLRMRMGIVGPQTCRHVSGKSLEELKDIVSAKKDDNFKDPEVTKIGDAYEFVIDEEILPLEDFISKIPELREHSESKILYTLTYPQPKDAKFAGMAIKKLKLSPSIETEWKGRILTISCPYFDTESFAKIRSNMPAHLTPDCRLEIESCTQVTMNDESIGAKLEARLNEESDKGILSQDKNTSFDIEVMVLGEIALERIGNFYNLTRERIRQIEMLAQRKLRSSKLKTMFGGQVDKEAKRLTKAKKNGI